MRKQLLRKTSFLKEDFTIEFWGGKNYISYNSSEKFFLDLKKTKLAIFVIENTTINVFRQEHVFSRIIYVCRTLNKLWTKYFCRQKNSTIRPKIVKSFLNLHKKNNGAFFAVKKRNFKNCMLVPFWVNSVQQKLFW